MFHRIPIFGAALLSVDISQFFRNWKAWNQTLLSRITCKRYMYSIFCQVCLIANMLICKREQIIIYHAIWYLIVVAIGSLSFLSAISLLCWYGNISYLMVQLLHIEMNPCSNAFRLLWKYSNQHSVVDSMVKKHNLIKQSTRSFSAVVDDTTDLKNNSLFTFNIYFTMKKRITYAWTV